MTMIINYGGIIEMSTIDYPSYSATVIFLRGCSVKCKGCHNKHLQNGTNLVDIDDILKLIDPLFINAVVISGGEPLEQIEAIKYISKYVRKLGLKIGLHTSGKGDLIAVLDCFDFILLSKPENMEWNK